MKTFFLLSAVLLSGHLAFAAHETQRQPQHQPPNGQRGLAAGIEAGMNVSFASAGPNTPDGASTRQGMEFGGHVQIPLQNDFFLQPEIRYTEKGANTKIIGLTGLVRLNYLEFALLIKKRWNGRRFSPYAFLGPTYDIAVTRELQVASLIVLPLSSRFGAIDMAVEAGGGVEYAVNANVAIYLQGRFDFGLFNIDQSNQTTYASRSLNFQLGGQFAF